MSDRLTYTASGKNDNWPRLVFPLMLFLAAVALIPVRNTAPSTLLHLPLGSTGLSVPMETLAMLLLLGQSGLLLRRMLPAKSPAALKAFATVCGIGIPFVFLQGFLHLIHSPFHNLAGAALMVSSWIFILYADKDALISVLASGLLAGLACSLSPQCVAGVPALALYMLFRKEPVLKKRWLHLLLWTAALLCGLIPALDGRTPLPLFAPKVFDPDFVRAGLQFILRNTPVWAWIFASIGGVVAVLQKQKILLGLVLPFLIFRILVSGFQPLEVWGLEATLLLAPAWFTAYGMLRVLRGFEQGVRRVNSKQAARIPAFATGGFVLGFLFKIADLYTFFR